MTFAPGSVVECRYALLPISAPNRSVITDNMTNTNPAEVIFVCLFQDSCTQIRTLWSRYNMFNESRRSRAGWVSQQSRSIMQKTNSSIMFLLLK